MPAHFFVRLSRWHEVARAALAVLVLLLCGACATELDNVVGTWRTDVPRSTEYSPGVGLPNPNSSNLAILLIIDNSGSVNVELNIATASGDLYDDSNVSHCNGSVKVASEKPPAGTGAVDQGSVFKFDFVACNHRFLPAESYGYVIKVDGTPTLVLYSSSFAGSLSYTKVQS